MASVPSIYSDTIVGLPSTIGTVTSVSGVNTNGFTWSIANSTTTPTQTLSFVGNSSIATVGTITSGTWQGTTIGTSYGGFGWGSSVASAAGNTGISVTASNNAGVSTIYSAVIADTQSVGSQCYLAALGASNAIHYAFHAQGATNVSSAVAYFADMQTGFGGSLFRGDVNGVSKFTVSSAGTITAGTWNGTAVTVPYGGTGNTTFTAYSVLCAGTTATGTFQNVSGVGTSGQVLTSNGASALPTWQSAASGVAAKNGKFNKTMTDASTSQTIAHGLGTTPKLVRFSCAWAVGSVTAPQSFGSYDGTHNQALILYNDGIPESSTSSTNSIQLTDGTNSQVASAAVDATNITLTWTKAGSPTGTGLITWEAIG